MRMKKETHVTMTNGEIDLLLKVEDSEDYPHTYGIEFSVDG